LHTKKKAWWNNAVYNTGRAVQWTFRDEPSLPNNLTEMAHTKINPQRQKKKLNQKKQRWRREKSRQGRGKRTRVCKVAKKATEPKSAAGSEKVEKEVNVFLSSQRFKNVTNRKAKVQRFEAAAKMTRRLNNLRRSCKAEPYLRR